MSKLGFSNSVFTITRNLYTDRIIKKLEEDGCEVSSWQKDGDTILAIYWD